MTKLSESNLVSPTALANYLKATGWSASDEDDVVRVWRHSDPTAKYIAAPKEDSVDFPWQFSDAVNLLSRFERRATADVESDIATGGADTVAVRFQPDNLPGEAPLEMADIAVHALRDLVLGSSSGVESPQLVLPSRRPARATSYARGVRLSSLSGSFILRLALPLNDELSGPAATPSADPVLLDVEGSPFGRRVTTRMRKMTIQALEVADRVGRGDVGLSSFAAGGPVAPNATELDALASLGNGGIERSRYEILFAQSPLSGKDRLSSPAKLAVTPSAQAVFSDAAEFLRNKQARTDVTIAGLVVSLARGDQAGPGSVTILGIDDDSNRPHRIQVELEASDYEKAIRAHSQGLQVEARGDLKTSGTKRSLSPLQEFNITEGLDAALLFSRELKY